MKKLLYAVILALLASSILSFPLGAVPWRFDNNVTIDGNLVVSGTFTAPPGSINLDNVTLNLNNFPSDLRPVKVVSSLPTCLDNNYPEGSVVYLTTDYKLYRCRDNGNWTSLIESTDLGGYLQPSVFSDNIITNNMIAGGIAASKVAVDNLSAFRADMGLLTAGAIELGYTAVGDDNTTAGTGIRLGSGKIEAYGGGHTFGGTVAINDGYYMVTIGKVLTGDGSTKRYPANNDTNFSVGGTISVYKWDDGWKEYLYIGKPQYGDTGFYLTSDASSGIVSDTSSGASSTGVSGAGSQYGVWGTGGVAGVYGSSAASGGVAGLFDGPADSGGPIRLVPSESGSAPTHIASVGTLWVTSGGILYINTGGDNTWQKVGSQ